MGMPLDLRDFTRTPEERASRLAFQGNHDSDSASAAASSPSLFKLHPDSDKYYGDKHKLNFYVTQLRIKLLVDAHLYVHHGSDTKQNKLSYAISCLGGDALSHIEPYVADTRINMPNVARFIEILKA